MSNSVFKYCSPLPHYIEMLQNYQVNCSHPCFLNDKYERAEYLIEPYKKFCDAIRWGASHKKQFDSHAIASFTNAERADSECLWRKYADSGRGFAIEYDSRVLEEEIFSQYVLPVHLQDVEYIDGRYDLDDFNNTFCFDGGRMLTVGECVEAFNRDDVDVVPLERLFQHLRLVKNQNEWHGEKESRLIIGNLQTNHHLHKTTHGFNLDLPPGAMKSVTLGPCINKAVEYTIRAIAKQHGLPVMDGR